VLAKIVNRSRTVNRVFLKHLVLIIT